MSKMVSRITVRFLKWKNRHWSKIRHRGGSGGLGEREWMTVSGRNSVIPNNARNEEGRVMRRHILVKGGGGVWTWIAWTNIVSFSLQLPKGDNTKDGRINDIMYRLSKRND